MPFKTRVNSLKDLLNKCAPFRVRFRKDSTIRGRVIQFNTKNELRVYIEYPIGKYRDIEFELKFNYSLLNIPFIHIFFYLDVRKHLLL